MDTDDDLRLFADVAARLKHAHALVSGLDAPASERRILTRRLLVITDAAKHDLRGAARRLDRFLDELDGPQGER